MRLKTHSETNFAYEAPLTTCAHKHLTHEYCNATLCIREAFSIIQRSYSPNQNANLKINFWIMWIERKLNQVAIKSLFVWLCLQWNAEYYLSNFNLYCRSQQIGSWIPTYTLKLCLMSFKLCAQSTWAKKNTFEFQVKYDRDLFETIFGNVYKFVWILRSHLLNLSIKLLPIFTKKFDKKDDKSYTI